MRTLTGVFIALCAATLFGTFSPKAVADTWDRKTVVTFNEPVEIPGRVLLAGTYVFSLEDSAGDRSIVQISREDDMQPVVTIFATTTERPKPATTSIFTFERRRADSPEALTTWFYPGDTTGLEFEYPTP